jgi:hypothetical protein
MRRNAKACFDVILEAATSAFTRVCDALWRLSGIHTPQP